MVCEKECPDRKAGCKISCEKWQAYETEYFAERKEKEKNLRTAARYQFIRKRKNFKK